MRRFSPAQLPYCAACSKLQNHVHIFLYFKKIGNFIRKKFLGFSDFHCCASPAKSRCLPPPLTFLLTSRLNKRMRKDLTPEDRQLVLDYSLWNLKRGPDGDDKFVVSSF